MPKAKPVRTAVIGAGNMGRHHVRNYAEMDAAELVGVSDPDPAKKALADAHKVTFYSDYREMLDRERPEAVSVVVPTTLHAELGMEILGRGIHLMMEKPIASTVQEADELMRLARNNHVIFTVGHIERYNPIVRKLRDLIAEDKFGHITSIVSKRVGGFPKVEPKTDVIIDLAVHDIDIINFLLNSFPKAVYSHGSRTFHSRQIDAAELLLDYGSASGFVQANWTTPVKVRTIAVTGSDGYVEGNYITQKLEYYEHNIRPRKSGEFQAFVDDIKETNQEIIEVDFEEPLALELGVFLRAVRGSAEQRLVDPRDAREALRIALEAVKDYQ